MKSYKFHCYLIFASHFHISEIFPDFSGKQNFADSSFRDISRGLNFVDGNFCGVSRGLHLAEKVKIRKIRKV